MSLAELVDHVIGVDPDRDRITAAVVCARTQGEIASKSFATTARGYGQAMRWAKDHTTDGRRAWSIESTGSYGAGLASALATRGEFVIEFEVDFQTTVFEGPLGEYTGYYTPGSMKPIARVTAITHRNDPIFQCLLTGVPPQENHVLKQLPFEASFFKLMREQFPTIRKVAIPASGGVSFYMVIAMKERYGGEARQAILAAMGTNLRPKHVVVVDPDIDVNDPDQVEWAIAFRTQPARDVIVVDQLPAGPLDPSVSDDIPLDQRRGSALGIDATYPFGLIVKVAGEACGASVAEHGGEFLEVADVPGWRDFDLPEINSNG